MSSGEFKTGKELSKIFIDLKEYIELRYDILKLEFIENFVKSISAFYTFLVLASLVSFAALFFSIGAAIYFGGILDSLPAGFMIVGLFYFMLIIVFLVFRSRLINRPLIRFVSKMLLKKPE